MVRVKFLAQGHNTMAQPGLKPNSLHSEWKVGRWSLYPQHFIRLSWHCAHLVSFIFNEELEQKGTLVANWRTGDGMPIHCKVPPPPPQQFIRLSWHCVHLVSFIFNEELEQKGTIVANWSTGDGMPIHCKVTPQHFIGLSWLFHYPFILLGGEREALWECFSQEHNTMNHPGPEPRHLDPNFRALIITPLHLSPPFRVQHTYYQANACKTQRAILKIFL